jgi:hypothetical protein
VPHPKTHTQNRPFAVQGKRVGHRGMQRKKRIPRVARDDKFKCRLLRTRSETCEKGKPQIPQGLKPNFPKTFMSEPFEAQGKLKLRPPKRTEGESHGLKTRHYMPG